MAITELERAELEQFLRRELQLLREPHPTPAAPPVPKPEPKVATPEPAPAVKAKPVPVPEPKGKNPGLENGKKYYTLALPSEVAAMVDALAKRKCMFPGVLIRGLIIQRFSGRKR